MMRSIVISAVFASLLIGLFISCKKDKLLTDPSAELNFSKDSVLFDTVFTTIGSATKNIRVINKHNQKINISSLRLENGNSSAFILNVDGMYGKSLTDIEIAANDSIYIFIQVNVNPTSQSSPLIISDKILFEINGNSQFVYLEAWGQDAYYHKPDKAIQFKTGGYLPYSLVTTGNNQTVTWTNDKPHVIYGWLVVDSTQTLIINKGVKVYFHQNAGLWVYRYGCLKVHGIKGDEVTFQGDRRELDYADEPGQWDRIWINEGSTQNEINYAIIKNGFIGIQAESIGTNSGIDLNTPRRLRLTNTIIKNMSKWGIYASIYNTYGGNNVIVNCKEYCGAFVGGGKHTFIHSTFANYWDKDDRSVPSVIITNYIGSQVLPLDSAYFGNCIIDGSTGNELQLDLNTSNVSMLPKYWFSHCLLRTTTNTSDANSFINCRINQAVNFKNPGNYEFELNANSNAIDMQSTPKSITDAGKFNLDVKGAPRPNGSGPDAGAYEK